MGMTSRLLGENPQSQVRVVTCPKFEASRPNPKRCVNYDVGGACKRDDFVMCVEWLKANEGLDADAALARSGHLAFGSDDAQGRFALATPPRQGGEAKRAQGGDGGLRRPGIRPLPPSVPEGPAEGPFEGLTDERLAALEASGYEFRLESPDMGEVWLVPSYTPEDDESGRVELSFTDARTLVLLTRALPGARVTQINRPQTSKGNPQ